MQNNPLDLLEPVIEPSGVSWLPLAIGWWLLFGLVLLLLAGLLVFQWFYNRRKTNYRTHAHNMLQQLRSVNDDQQFAYKLNTILKRTAVVTYDRALVASLNGVQWLEFLDKTLGENAFLSKHGHAMLHCQYAPKNKQTSQQKLDRSALLLLSTLWIQKHYKIDTDYLRTALKTEVPIRPLKNSKHAFNLGKDSAVD